MKNDLLNSSIFIHENSIEFEKIFENSYTKLEVYIVKNIILTKMINYYNNNKNNEA